jgi:hypothetical protein
MRRRDLLNSLAGGYSLYVFAGKGAQGQTPTPPSPLHDPGRFEAVSPHSEARLASPEPHMRLVELECDVLVAGGGLAGVCAAVAAARHGARVVLVQDRSRLGGNSSSEVKMHVVGANSHKGRPGWRDSGLIEEFRLDDAANNPQRSFEMWDVLLYDKVISEPNITLLLETVVYSAEMKGDRIERVMARCDKSEHLYRIRAKYFCDCTGDSRLGIEAGADYRLGREARSEFNEPLAPEKPDADTLGSSVLFTSRLYHRPMSFKAPAWARKVTKEQLMHRQIDSWEYGYWWIEWGGDLSTIADNERIRFELLSIVLGVWDYIKNSGEFGGSSNWAMDWIGMMPGKRGSRRLLGDHILTQQDVMNGNFEDAVAIGGWPLDDHPPAGFDRPELKPNVAIRIPEVYNIPLRSMYSRNVSNLFMAGRNLSATHVAFTSARVMATCSVIGQAAGTAAAHCVEMGVTPRQLARDPKHVTRLQQALIRDDQTIKGMRGQDPLDLAKSARITASGEIAPTKAALVTDGHVRDIPDKQGDPVEYHHWAAALPAWIELEWDHPQRIREVQITFDTGFKRELMLTAQDSANVNIVRAPQPETVRDYKVMAGERVLATVTNNHQRVNRVRFEPAETKSIRIAISAAHGIEQAHVFEIRCYA